MCLAVPMKLSKIQGTRGLVEIGGVQREVGLELIENAQVGDYLIVHAGYAIEILDRTEAKHTIELLRQLEF